MSAPERIWTNYREANRLDIAYDEPPRHPDDDCKDAYILVTAHEAAVAAARAEAYREGWSFAYRQCERTGSVPDPDYKPSGAAQ